MTNEELVMLIKNGDDGYMPQLWEQIRKLIVCFAKAYYNKCENKHGVELDDLIQSSYFGVLKAVKDYTPAKGLKFTSYLTFNCKNSFQKAMGIKSSKRNILDYSLSLDAPLTSDNEDFTLLDTLADLTPSDELLEANIIEDIYNKELRAALDKSFSVLSNRQKNILELRYYFGISQRKIAEIQNTSPNFISQTELSALNRIRKSKYIKELAGYLDITETLDLSYKGLSLWEEHATTEQKELLAQRRIENVFYSKSQ